MRLLIIGGSDAGISAALRAQELSSQAEIAIVLRDAFPNFSICGLPFYISGETPDWRQLAHRTDFSGLEILTDTVAESIDAARRTVHVRTSEGGRRLLRYDKLIIATGARPLIPAIPGIGYAYPLHTLADSFRLHDSITRDTIRRAAIVGAGYIGVELADALSHRGIEVQLIGRSHSVLPTVDPELGQMIREQLEKKDVRVYTGVQITRIANDQGGLRIEGSAGFACEADLIIWSAGVEPASDLAQTAGVRLGGRKACEVTRRMETNVPDVYAAGDCAETWHRILQRNVWLPLGTTAHKQGRVAGENAIGGGIEFQGTLGTQVVKVFDLAIARTGLLNAEAKRFGFQAQTVASEWYDHKAYYPGAEKLCFRVTGDHATGRLLGAQITGNWKAEVAKRIDVFAAALYHGMKVHEFDALDLSYTPPLASPWDAIQLAAQAWTQHHSELRKREAG